MQFLFWGRPNVEKYADKGDIENLCHAAKYKKDPEVREIARAALQTHLDWLITELGSRNLRKIILSREAISLIGEPAVPRLVDVLHKGDTHRRQDVAYALGEVGLPSCIEPLEWALGNADGLLRVLAVKSLAKIDDPRCIELIESALRDSDEGVRYQASKALKSLSKLHERNQRKAARAAAG